MLEVLLLITFQGSHLSFWVDMSYLLMCRYSFGRSAKYVLVVGQYFVIISLQANFKEAHAVGVTQSLALV